MTLAEKTKAYWEVSRCWHGRHEGKPYTIEQAMRKLNGALAELNPQRPVAQLSSSLLFAIINKPDKKAASGS